MTDEPHHWVQPTIDRALTDKEKHLCREIVRQCVVEVRLSQRQLMFLMDLFVLNLEDRDCMILLREAILSARKIQDEKAKGNLVTSTPKSGLLIP